MIRIVVLFFSLLTVSSTSFAADAPPRKIDFTVAILDYDDEPIVECVDPITNPPLSGNSKECKSKKSWTLGLISLRALSTLEQGLTAENSLHRGQLAKSVYKSPDAELPSEDIALIKMLIARTYNPLIVEQTFRMLK